MSKLDRSYVYKKFRKVLIDKYGKELTIVIWRETNIELNHLLNQYNHVGVDEKMMILPLYALYITLKKYDEENALDLLKEYGIQIGADISKGIRIMTSIPGFSKLLWNNMPKLMRITSSPKKGYKKRIVSESKELVGVDILRCPLHEMAKTLGTPEITSVVCLIDKGQMSGFRHIDYTRTKSLGEGDEYCDYRLNYNRKK